MSAHGPIKTFIYQSKFSTSGNLKSITVPEADILKGIWQMQLRSFSWSEQKSTVSVQQVACNWITNYVVDVQGSLHSLYAPLELMQTVRKFNGRVQHSNDRWIELNNASRSLQFFVLDARTRDPLKSDIGDFIAYFSLRRIR